ncbi:MAG TPA: hypothetical protein EYH50_02730 [Pyrodictium delaneyi]|uniref:THUMP domain-containing protein n=1 Tax=Pyrodictium delaneyi TaxID=1273541 RepID=A0A832ZUC1_9CREN|nr:hypothetical protein [Pyrodictium delaneyi]
MPGRRLVLVATTEPWHLSAAAEEIGDALFKYDEDVEIKIDDRVPLLYVLSSRLSSTEAFRLVIREPPATVERVVPVEHIVDVHTSLDDYLCLRRFMETLMPALEGRIEGKALGLEVKPRGFFLVGGNEKKWNRALARFLSEIAGVRVLRKAPSVVKVEDTRYGVVVAVIRSKWDRIQMWRSRRLGWIVTEEGKR